MITVSGGLASVDAGDGDDIVEIDISYLGSAGQLIGGKWV